MRSNLSKDDPMLFEKRIAEKEQQRMDHYRIVKSDPKAAEKLNEKNESIPAFKFNRRAFE